MKPAVFWIGMVVGLLLLSVGTQVALLVAAVNDPSFALEPDYERKAAEWDRLQAERRRSDDLAWEVQLRTAPAAVAGGVRVELELADAAGSPIHDASVAFDAFHNARASRIVHHRLPLGTDGIYRATLPLVPSGIWEFRLEITRGDDRFVRTLRTSVISPGPALAGRVP